MCDSGGFTELSLHGQWTTSPAAYAAAVYRYQDQIGQLAWAAACQDWMVEPQVLRRSGLSVREHQRRTTASYLTLRDLAPALPWAPVLQGHTPADYLHHTESYLHSGVDLTVLPAVGVGSVCRRTNPAEVTAILTTLHRHGISGLHGFGITQRAARRATAAGALGSWDSLAWSYAGRYLPGCTRSHRTEANCLTHALTFRQRLLTRTTPTVRPAAAGTSQGGPADIGRAAA